MLKTEELISTLNISKVLHQLFCVIYTAMFINKSIAKSLHQSILLVIVVTTITTTSSQLYGETGKQVQSIRVSVKVTTICSSHEAPHSQVAWSLYDVFVVIRPSDRARDTKSPSCDNASSYSVVATT